MDQLFRAIEKDCGSNFQIQSSQPIHGGDINECYKLITTRGPFFLKVNSTSFAGMFRKEFNGLLALDNSNTIKVPQPIATGEVDMRQWLVMEWLEKGTPSRDFWKNFAQQLASLHKTSNDLFGFTEDNYIGSIIQKNTQMKSWAEFYSMRILCLVEMLVDNGRFNEKEIKLAEHTCKQLKNIFPEEKPALLHGDLWGGNYMVHSNGDAAVYDPAVYFGHREMDLGMSLLFGGFDKSFYEFYNEEFPLEVGWKQRVELCQLYPVLVHAVLFGGHYGEAARSIFFKYR